MKKNLNIKVFLFALLLFISNMSFAQTCHTNLTASIGLEPIVIYPSDVLIEDVYTATSISKDGINFNESVTFGCGELGEHILTVLATLGGVEDTCETIFVIQDIMSPAVAVQDAITIHLVSETDIYTLDTSDIGYNGWDNCGIMSYALSQTEFSIDDWGTTTVFLTVTDDSGNESTAWFTVTILLNNTPSPFSCITGLNVEASYFGGSVTIYPNDFNASNTSYDEMLISIDGGLTYTSSIELTCDNIGLASQEVDIQAFLDGEVYSCQSFFTFIDNTSPVAIVNGAVSLILDENGEATLTVQMVDDGSFDNCSGITYELSQTLFTTVDIGTNTVILTVTDESGNSNQAWTTVSVSSTSGCEFPESIQWPINITINSPNLTALEVSPEDLEGNFGYTFEEVNATYPEVCDFIAVTYTDLVIVNPAVTKILRIWVSINWNTSEIATHNQIIKIIHENNNLACLSEIAISVANGSVTISPVDVLAGYSGDPSNLNLFITDSEDNVLLGNIITPNYAGQTLTYTVNNSVMNSCWGFIIVNTIDDPCPINEEDLSWPLPLIEISNPSQSPSVLSPELLSSEYGFDPSEVNCIVDNDCAITSKNFHDEIINDTNGYFQIIRTFTLIDWLVYDSETLVGFWTFTQIINNSVDPLSLICDVLPRTADVGDCDSGHTLDDDVEWPANISIVDYRITPDELVDFSTIDVLDTKPSFYNTPEDYTATYTDLLIGLTTEEITVGRVWLVANTTYNLTWTYSQEIIVDISDFSNLVTVNTPGLRPMPNVRINNMFLTNENGITYVPDPSISSISYDDSVNNGINILDLVLLKHHILHIVNFTPPQWKAGDIDNSGLINALDVLLLQRLILLFKDDDGWVFVNDTESLNVEPMPKAHFSAFKRGDFNDSALLYGESIDVSDESEFTFNDELINAGETYEIPIYFNTETNAYGVEFHVQIDESILTVDSVSSDYFFPGGIEWNINGRNLVILLQHYGIDYETLGGDSAAPVFTIHATAVKNSLLHQVFNFENQYSYIATKDYELITLGGDIDDIISTGTKEVVLSDIGVYPNPASQFIYINTDKLTINGDFFFELRNIMGQSVLKTVNQHKINVSTLTTGIYLYTIVSDGFEVVGKLSIAK